MARPSSSSSSSSSASASPIRALANCLLSSLAVDAPRPAPPTTTPSEPAPNSIFHPIDTNTNIHAHTHRDTHTDRRSSTGSPFQPFSILLHFQLPSASPSLLTPHCPLILLSFSADCLRHLAFMWSRRDAASRLAEHAPGHNRVSPPTLPHSPSPTAFYFCLALLPSPSTTFQL